MTVGCRIPSEGAQRRSEEPLTVGCRILSEGAKRRSEEPLTVGRRILSEGAKRRTEEQSLARFRVKKFCSVVETRHKPRRRLRTLSLTQPSGRMVRIRLCISGSGKDLYRA